MNPITRKGITSSSKMQRQSHPTVSPLQPHVPRQPQQSAPLSTETSYTANTSESLSNHSHLPYFSEETSNRFRPTIEKTNAWNTAKIWIIFKLCQFQFSVSLDNTKIAMIIVMVEEWYSPVKQVAQHFGITSVIVYQFCAHYQKYREKPLLKKRGGNTALPSHSFIRTSLV